MASLLTQALQKTAIRAAMNSGESKPSKPRGPTPKEKRRAAVPMVQIGNATMPAWACNQGLQPGGELVEDRYCGTKACCLGLVCPCFAICIMTGGGDARFTYVDPLGNRITEPGKVGLCESGTPPPSGPTLQQPLMAPQPQQMARQQQQQQQQQQPPPPPQMTTVVPQGAMPGQQFQVQGPGGAILTLTVPPGAMPGQQMSFTAPRFDPNTGRAFA